MDSEIKQKLQLFFDAKEIRLTSQREAIIEAAFGTNRHFTAEELLDMARERDASVSRATVYRTLPLLVESGLIKEMDFGKAYKFYDPNYATHPNHNHLICVDCDKIVEFEDPIIEKRENEISRSLGFLPENKSVQIRATCQELKNSGACANKANCERK
ncbi:MAG: transcriptional repressor [Verrucomicrobiae bacterium]|nr:transcriptional repressor [Verrucomicrobiae bacterium]